jgi:Flp pilus assembly protein TadG
VGRSGQSLVELAFATPVLVLLLLGTIDLGRLYFDYIQLRSAVIDGALYAARHPADTAGAIAEAQASGVPTGSVFSVTVNPGCLSAGGSGNATVSAVSTFRPLTTTFFSRIGLDSWTLRASSTMRCLT